MKVKTYTAAWNLNTNKGVIGVKTEEDDKTQKLDINSASEFIAVLSVLQGEGQAYINEKGWIGTHEIED